MKKDSRKNTGEKACGISPGKGDVDQRILFLHELFSLQQSIDIWKVDRDLTLIETQSSVPDLFSDLFLRRGCGQLLMAHFTEDTASPLLLEDPMDLAWISDSAADGTIFLLGPILSEEVREPSLISLEKSLPLDRKLSLMEGLKKAPCLSPAGCRELALMLHFCTSGEKLTVSDLSYVRMQRMESRPLRDENASPISRTDVWTQEKQLLLMVQEGKLDERTTQHLNAILWKVLRLEKDTELRLARESASAFAVLTSRAAIDGGLSPELSLSLYEQYTRSIEASPSLSETAGICRRLLEDYVQRVYRKRESTELSPAIRDVRDYIDAHRCDSICLSDLAAFSGYSEYYLSRKFKTETGIQINDYIRKSKVEEARFLLESTDQSIMDISIALNYKSRSYFSDSFRLVTGLSPSRYRNEWQKASRKSKMKLCAAGRI